MGVTKNNNRVIGEKNEFKPVIGASESEDIKNNQEAYTDARKRSGAVDGIAGFEVKEGDDTKTDSEKAYYMSSKGNERLKYDLPISDDTEKRLEANIMGKPSADAKESIDPGQSTKGNKKFLDRTKKANAKDNDDIWSGNRVDQILPIEKTAGKDNAGVSESMVKEGGVHQDGQVDAFANQKEVNALDREADKRRKMANPDKKMLQKAFKKSFDQIYRDIDWQGPFMGSTIFGIILDRYGNNKGPEGAKQVLEMMKKTFPWPEKLKIKKTGKQYAPELVSYAVVVDMSDSGVNESPLQVSKYTVLVPKDDSGKVIKVVTTASSEEAAKANVANYLGCPTQALQVKPNANSMIMGEETPMVTNETPKANIKNNIVESKKMKRLNYKRTSFINEQHMADLLPEGYKVDGNKFHMKDKDENDYLIEWDSKEGGIVIVEHKNPKTTEKIFEDFDRLCGYKGSKHMKTTTVTSRVDENKMVGDLIATIKEVK